MKNFETKISEKEAIANWEDEGGALRPIAIPKSNNKALFICLGCLVTLPLLYWLARRA